MERPRAADDFEVIRGRLEELRRERDAITPTGGEAAGGDAGDEETERRRREQCEGGPPAWVPTIFLPQPTD